MVAAHRTHTAVAVAIGTDSKCRIYYLSHDFVLDYTVALVDTMLAVDSMNAMWDLGKSVNYSTADLIVADDSDCQIFDWDRLLAVNRGLRRTLDCSCRYTMVGYSLD